MISVNKAIDTLKKVVSPLLTETKSIKHSNTYVLAKDISAPIDLPPFNQSAMDGYAICFNTDSKNLNYLLLGEIKAGNNKSLSLSAGDAVRIFTGAMVPLSADAVIMQEKVKETKNSISLESQPKKNANIRPLGEQIKQGQLALKKGSLLTPAAIGFLSSLGLETVVVYSRAKIAIIVTGNELLEPGQELTDGKIYESNARMLHSAIAQHYPSTVTTYQITDNYEQTVKKIQEALSENDLLIISGGISVGDYDYVEKALIELKTVELFYKVKQKPGKPLYVGKNKGKYIFALPGNPAASLTCFYIYTLPFLKCLSGESTAIFDFQQARISQDYVKKGDRAQFLKAELFNGSIRILKGQSSAMLHTFSFANALVYLPADLAIVQSGDLIDVIPIN